MGAPGEDSSSTGVGSLPNEGASNSGAVYVFTRSGSTWTEQAYIKASNTGGIDLFGWSVALSGDTLAVGAPGEDSSASDSGAVYVFTRSGSTWTEQAYIKASNTGEFDLFGESVALSGDTLVVGARFEDTGSGAVYVFTRSGSTWTEQAYIKASNTGEGDQFGWSVALSGDTLAVGAPGENSSSTGVGSLPNEGASDSGAVYVFTRSGSTWTEQAYIKASNTGGLDSFGESVALSGDTLAVGPLVRTAAAPASAAFRTKVLRTAARSTCSAERHVAPQWVRATGRS